MNNNTGRIVFSLPIPLSIFTMKQKGLESNLSITIIMAGLTLLSIAFLIWNIKNIKTEIA